MYDLLLTLGHGSSAILIKDGKIVNGYMNERISKVKSDSVFPIHAILKLIEYHDIPKDVTIYVSHWDPSGDVHMMKPKHWDPMILKKLFPYHKLISCNKEFTHHDAHAFSIAAYNDLKINSHVIISDGFGTMGEVSTVYNVIDSESPNRRFLKKLLSVKGLNKSLGLLYQFATDYVGLKMNQDEWKLNAKSTKYRSNNRDKIDELARKYIKGILDDPFNLDYDPIVSENAFTNTHVLVHEYLKTHFPDKHKGDIALFLQLVVQGVISVYMDAFRIENIYLAGGVFMNVQLNGFIMDKISGKICVMPLSGDYGAALGVYKAHNPDFTIDNFCFGKRSLKPVSVDEGLVTFSKDIVGLVRKSLKENKIVNVIKGDMEFGERALCNTSTLALPTIENAKYINSINGRDVDMPLCPVITRSLYKDIFRHTDKVIRSAEHMIMAFPYQMCKPEWRGASHDLNNNQLSGRPQVVDPDHWIYPIVDELGPIINTSFNNHGKPICYGINEVIRTASYMRELDVNKRVVTIVEINE